MFWRFQWLFSKINKVRFSAIIAGLVNENSAEQKSANRTKEPSKSREAEPKGQGPNRIEPRMTLITRIKKKARGPRCEGKRSGRTLTLRLQDWSQRWLGKKSPPIARLSFEVEGRDHEDWFFMIIYSWATLEDVCYGVKETFTR